MEACVNPKTSSRRGRNFHDPGHELGVGSLKERLSPIGATQILMPHTQDNSAKDSGILVVSQGKPAKANCWSCGAMRAAHFCQQCGKVQPPVPVDYFTFFGLPYKLNLESGRLEREFYDLSRHLHPDINAIKSDREQEWALEQSSHLNDAYRTLKDPITRTEYLLRLQGVQLEEQSKAATEEARRTGQAEEAGRPARSAGRGLSS